MNQKDYKAIAEIIAKHINEVALHKKISTDLADYFEKINQEAYTDLYEKKYNMKNVKQNWFNKEQFLKECGVK